MSVSSLTLGRRRTWGWSGTERRGRQRVEIPFYKAGVDAQPGQGLIALVGRNDQVARDRREDETGVQGHGPHHIAERCIVCHMGLPSVDSRAEMGAGPQAGMELAS